MTRLVPCNSLETVHKMDLQTTQNLCCYVERHILVDYEATIIVVEHGIDVEAQVAGARQLADDRWNGASDMVAMEADLLDILPAFDSIRNRSFKVVSAKAEEGEAVIGAFNERAYRPGSHF